MLLDEFGIDLKYGAGLEDNAFLVSSTNHIYVCFNKQLCHHHAVLHVYVARTILGFLAIIGVAQCCWCQRYHVKVWHPWHQFAILVWWWCYDPQEEISVSFFDFSKQQSELRTKIIVHYRSTGLHYLLVMWCVLRAHTNADQPSGSLWLALTAIFPCYRHSATNQTLIFIIVLLHYYYLTK